jgi:hypothetical protein
VDAKEFIKYAALLTTGAYAQHRYSQHQVFRDPGFLSVLDAALKNATKEEVEQIVNLKPDQIRDWAMAPTILRPKLIEKWASEKQQESKDKFIIKTYERQANKRGAIGIVMMIFGFVTFMYISISNANTMYSSEKFGYKWLMYLGLFVAIAGIITGIRAMSVPDNVKEAKRRLGKWF